MFPSLELSTNDFVTSACSKGQRAVSSGNPVGRVKLSYHILCGVPEFPRIYFQQRLNLARSFTTPDWLLLVPFPGSFATFDHWSLGWREVAAAYSIFTVLSLRKNFSHFSKFHWMSIISTGWPYWQSTVAKEALSGPKTCQKWSLRCFVNCY
jgi:hypothetical protein